MNESTNHDKPSGTLHNPSWLTMLMNDYAKTPIQKLQGHAIQTLQRGQDSETFGFLWAKGLVAFPPDLALVQFPPAWPLFKCCGFTLAYSLHTQVNISKKVNISKQKALALWLFCNIVSRCLYSVFSPLWLLCNALAYCFISPSYGLCAMLCWPLFKVWLLLLCFRFHFYLRLWLVYACDFYHIQNHSFIWPLCMSFMPFLCMFFGLTVPLLFVQVLLLPCSWIHFPLIYI